MKNRHDQCGNTLSEDFEVREPLQIILMETGQQANRNLENKPTGVLKNEA